jgi:arylsulfatase
MICNHVNRIRARRAARLCAFFVAVTLIFALEIREGVAEQRKQPPISETPAQRPNIIVVVFDDVGFSDFGCFGSEIRTPTIDAVAAGGLRYNRFDNKAVCSASRAALLTGRNNQTVRMGFLPSELAAPDPRDNSADKGELPANAETVAEALRETGYATFAVGKWHLTPAYEGGSGAKITAQTPKTSWPLQRGFDHFYGFLGGWTDQYSPALVEDNAPTIAPERPGYHLTEDLVDHAIADLRNSRRATPDKPVFLYLALGVAHAPIQVPRHYIDLYRDTYTRGWDEIRAARFARAQTLGIVPRRTALPARPDADRAWASLDEQRRTVFARFMAAYAGFIQHGDEQLGRLVSYLKTSGQYENTLLVMLSDNGAASEGGSDGEFEHPYGDHTSVAQMDARLSELGGPTLQPLYQRPWAMASNSPLRRYKLWPFAGGSRSPLIISWPRAIHDAGAIRPQNVDIVDLAPTLLDAAGERFEARFHGITQIPIAGRSVRATFDSAAAPTRDVQFFELSGNRAIRSRHWKAVAMHEWGTDFEHDRWQLFDTSRDFSESQDVAARYPSKLAEMKSLWQTEAAKYGALPLNGTDPQVRAWAPFDEYH